MGKYQLDTKGKTAVTKYHEKHLPEKADKKQQLKEMREKFLKNKQKSDQ
ncbi:hypothetical protein DOK76_06430 [Vagococcus sp. DIV0080]|uniref:Alcohol dehydrogenase n=1 Tax=Candidatus Vagococcus giribetii TaxID=2230876 RepID=A0ABS3HSG8_9ENTE|nr:hypothetical protein [Vagococcus sp. DIV0080]MBO0476701.1 hypothetical protein [Vagococcus sp. DIV0080]